MKNIRFITVLVSIAITFLSVRCQEENRGYIVNTGDNAPDFEMQLTSGEIIKLSDLRGKIVMLQFTASWCGVCRKEMPHIEKEIWQKLKDRENFALYGIDRDEPIDVVEKYIKKVGTTYPIGLDPNGKIFKLYAHEKAGITRNVIIDQYGKIVYLTRLFDYEEFNSMKQKIFELLKLK